MTKKRKLGDCYQVAGQIALDLGFYKGKPMPFKGTPYVVHAEVSGQGDIEGLRYGHAWVEDDENVFDYSNGRELVIPKRLYYFIGQVQMRKPKYFKYTLKKARLMMLKTGHYGAWELETESGL